MKNLRLFALALYFCGFGLLSALAQSPASTTQPSAPTTPATPTYADFQAAQTAAQTFAQAKDYEKAVQAFDAAVSLAAKDSDRAEALFGAGKAWESVPRRVHAGGSGKYASYRTEYGDWYQAQRRYHQILKLKDLPNETKLKAGQAIFEAPASKLSEPLPVMALLLALPNLAPDVRAEWLLRRGQFYLSAIMTGGPYQAQQTVQQNATAALADFTAVAATEQIADLKKAEALLQIGYLQTGLKQLDKALEAYAQTILLPQAQDGQKAKALMKSAELQAHQGKTPEAVASLTRIFTLKSLTASEKVSAHKMLAQAYLLQKNLPAAITELGKISALPNLTAYNKISALEENGDLLLGANAPSAARTEFEKALNVPPTDKSRISYLHMKIGKTYQAEKNYVRAREALKTAVSIEGASNSYKEEAWQLLGDTLAQGQNYPAAIEAYQKVTADPKASVFIKINAALGLAQAAKSAGDFAQTAAAYDLVLSNYFSTNMSPVQINTVRTNKQAVFTVIQNVALEFSKTAASQNAAIAIFRSFLKNAKYNDAEMATIYLAWGDVLYQQNNLDSAKTIYQKIPSTQRPQYIEAIKKLQEITAKLNANGNPQ
ncbi:MAG: tetratricopeptide repeat protein [Blastocatellia bacterium]|nr:tetratricopeptide repeat protein [Blastocatellia bacterium]